MTVEKEFGADPKLKKLYRAYLALVTIGVFLWWMIPVVAVAFSFEMLTGVVAALVSFVPLLIAVAIALYWIPNFHSSINYVLEDDEIIVTKGVWWKTKSVVPYNRITNVNIYQGPISRHFGLGRLSIQTAGFSGVSSSGHKTAEAEIFGVENFEEIKDMVMKFVKGIKPVAVEAEAEARPSKDINEQILQELRRIRKAAEK
ncbi:MAG: PH domain-containing protein [Candidatus Bathyarchaeota archaeon]|nr:PH domain-containing protein [Candidatus Bathyarchaeota archaeon]